MIPAYSYKEYTTPSRNIKICICRREKDHSIPEKIKETKYYIKQRLSGLGLLIIGIVVTILTTDGTILLFSLPIGIALIFSKEKVMIF